MNTSTIRRGHLNRFALRALIGHDDRSRAQIAIAAEMTPSACNDLFHGRRHGRDPATRSRLAEALGVDPRAIECLCDTPADHEVDA